MFSTIINRLASTTQYNKAQAAEVAEFQAIKAEINKARCVIEFDSSGQITTVNENMLKSIGYSNAELVGQHHRTLIGRVESSSAEYKNFWNNLAQGQTQTGIFKLKNKLGHDVWFQGYYAAIMTNDSLRKVVAYLTDTTSASLKSNTLQSEEEALSNAFGIMECDMKANILDCNELFSKPLGYDKADLTGKHVSVFLDKETLQSASYVNMWEKLNQGQSVSTQTKRIAKDRQEYWFQSTYVPILNEEKIAYKVVVYSFCITAEKLKNADFEGQLKAINKIQGVIEFDLKGNILAVNENFAKVTGYSEKEIVGNHHSMFVESNYKGSSEYKSFWEKLARGEVNDGMFHRVGKGGKEIWLQASYNPILGLDGKPFKVVKYATDVTDFKLKEADSSGQLQALDKVLGVIEFDLTGKITKVNDNFASLTGYGNNEIVGNHHSMFVDSTYKASSEYKAFWEKLGRGEADTGQYKRIGKGGKEVWLQASYNPILDLNGKPFKVVKFATDITAQHVAATSLETAVEETQQVIESAKAGDLTDRVSLDGKTGAIASLCDGVNALMDKMTEVIAQVREAGETINTAAGEIASGNNDLSQRTEQQASSLEETASSMEELASTVKQNAENAKQANQLAAAASGVALRGGEVVGNVVTTMADINTSAKKIEDIISVIDGIAFQTNILALNAAVEAARAGEQGRGFAVVAGEVRNLAQRSASAAKEIKDLISDSVSKTAEGTRLVESAGSTMQEIVTSVQRVTDIMGEIAAASSEQSSGIDQVNTAITSMDEVTQQNAALVEEAAAAAESLVEQATNLMDTVGGFKLQGRAQERRASNSPMRQSTTVHRKVANLSKSASKLTPAKALAKTGTDDADEWAEF
jgi:methyl-accepting chemotaxis protein